MKTLFLIDGAYQAAKPAFCSIIKEKMEQSDAWVLITKYSTKLAEDEEKDDLVGINPSIAKTHLDTYAHNTKRQEERIKSRYFCYEYPVIDGYKNVTNCIDTQKIDELIDNNDIQYGFLIVRNDRCINDLIYKYEQNGRLNVVPVFLYTDYTYIAAAGDKEVEDKWNKLLRKFIGNRGGDDDNKVVYESVLIFNGEKNCKIPSEMAVANLKQQVITLIERVKNKNNNLVVVTENDRTYLPEYIRSHKDLLESSIKTPDDYQKNVFVMMKFHGDILQDRLYHKVKQAIEAKGYHCLRADELKIKEIFPEDNNSYGPDIRYWLATFLCKRGIAIFEKDNNNRVLLNPNIAYEMGIMKQQGKHVDIFVPSISPNNDEKLFFDIDKNSWKNKYSSDSDLIEKIMQSLK